MPFLFNPLTGEFNISEAASSGGGNISGTWSSTGNVVTTDGADTAQDSGIASTALTTLTGIQTLTNKTLTSPIITTPTGFIEVFTGFIVAAEDGSYTLDEFAKYAYTVNDITVKTSAGTAIMAVQINASNITGLDSVAISSVQNTDTASAANSVAIGNRLSFVLSSSSSPENLAFTLKVTRA